MLPILCPQSTTLRSPTPLTILEMSRNQSKEVFQKLSRRSKEGGRDPGNKDEEEERKKQA